MSSEINQAKPITEENAKKLIALLANTPKDTVSKSMEFAKKPVYTIRNNQIFASLIGTGGLVIFALGLENLISNIPQLSSPLVLIGIGLFLLLISGLTLKKLG
jgi:hypothetical protein